ncbi:host attachment protein [Thioalkalicoccus limnaeus]|uniref:Host attachment protein n=1 Tax=Thioalkalicoccus limnaeus TaxID=120681 RepID=A0ABV4B8Z5_9GAMM
MKTWVIVASATRARLFETSGPRKPLEEILDLSNPEERLLTQEIESDKPGRVFDRVGGQRHATQTAVDAKEQVAVRFAKAVVERLASGRYEKRFDALYVVAPPHFLGLLRDQMSVPLSETVKGEVVKDLTREDAAEIQSQLARL